MRVFVAGATGAVGRPLVRRLLEAGHEVVGMTRTAAKQAWLEDVGATAVLCDAARDPDAVVEAVVAARPDVVMDQLTDPPQEVRAFEGPSNSTRLTGLAPFRGRTAAQRVTPDLTRTATLVDVEQGCRGAGI